MTTKLLLPNKFKLWGWVILIPSFVAGILIISFNLELTWLNNIKVFSILKQDFGNTEYFSFIKTNITNTIVGIFLIIGALLVGFSKEKTEDEFISGLRLNSLLWSVWANYILLLFAFLFIYDFAFISVMVYNIFTTLILFIIRFNFVLYRSSKAVSYEK